MLLVVGLICSMLIVGWWLIKVEVLVSDSSMFRFVIRVVNVVVRC